MNRLAGFLLIVTSVWSWGQAPDCASLSRQAMEMSGINLQIDAMGKTALSDEYFEQLAAGNNNGPEFAAVLKPIVRKHLDGDLLKKDLLSRMVARCKPEQMSQVIGAMQTPFMARMLQLEAAQYTSEGQEQIKKYMRIIQIAPPPDSQLDSAAAFDQKAELSDSMVDYLLAITRGMLKGAGAPDTVVQRLEERRKQMKAQIQGTVLAAILLTYKGVSKPDLAKYGDQLSSVPLKWYYDAVHIALVEMLLERSEAIGHEIKAAVTAKG